MPVLVDLESSLTAVKGRLLLSGDTMQLEGNQHPFSYEPLDIVGNFLFASLVADRRVELFCLLVGIISLRVTRLMIEQYGADKAQGLRLELRQIVRSREIQG